MYRVVKRNGNEVDFDISKISVAISKAFDACEKEYNQDVIDLIALRVTANFSSKIEDGKIAVYGRSAGGLLIGAVLTMRPGAFDLAAAEVPFVDALNTMLDESLPLTVGEFSEWGNPRIREFFDYIRSYSPYDNVRRTEYPPVYLYSAMNDSRVMYWEPLKFMARLRRYRTDSNVSILTLADCRGHFGASGRYDSIDEKARLFAFVISGLS